MWIRLVEGNSVVTDQLASSMKPAELAQHCFEKNLHILIFMHTQCAYKGFHTKMRFQSNFNVI